uniref:ankyrin repeat-containing protein ITN1-like n=1 Tax=Erigeron canadensis TaxID=72917 RepID=UPI001CB90D85|nr:ankyrin repeat-containing protein ITN1-like [Erigeron canadensis]
MEFCVPLYEAAITGDWEAAKLILDKRLQVVQFVITPYAAKGHVHMFEVILNKHKEILSILPDETLGTLNSSALGGNHGMTLHFYNVLEKTPLLEIEKMVVPSFRNSMNDDGETPLRYSQRITKRVFKGLKLTKDCMVVATLIITVAFAVAYTVPGGYNQETGIPIFHHDPSFLVFIIADAFSLFTSSTSLLVFLSILTSPHGQRDFLYAMPRKLMIGLVTLFMSVVGMMVRQLLCAL